MQNPAEKQYFMEDLAVGQVFTAGPVQVTAAEIIAFARQFDPQIFHTDPEAAKDTLFKGLIASGWHTASMTMRMITQAFPPMPGGMIGRTMENLGWPRPVRPGDTLSYRAEILSMEPSKDPARGILRIKNTTLNQDGKTVMEMTSVVFVPRRPA